MTNLFSLTMDGEGMILFLMMMVASFGLGMCVGVGIMARDEDKKDDGKTNF